MDKERLEEIRKRLRESHKKCSFARGECRSL